jgi:ABC-type phosphate transport system ATPase subunit
MANLTSKQVKELADNMLRMTNALGNYRYENFDRLTEEENLQLKGLHRQQLENTTELYTKSAVLVMDDVETSLQKIDTITVETQKLYKKLVTVQKVLDRATSVLTLASAIIGLDPTGIASSIKSLSAPAS